MYVYKMCSIHLLELSTFNTEEVEVELVLILTHTTHEVTSSTNLLTQIRNSIEVYMCILYTCMYMYVKVREGK